MPSSSQTHPLFLFVVAVIFVVGFFLDPLYPSPITSLETERETAAAKLKEQEATAQGQSDRVEELLKELAAAQDSASSERQSLEQEVASLQQQSTAEAEAHESRLTEALATAATEATEAREALQAAHAAQAATSAEELKKTNAQKNVLIREFKKLKEKSIQELAAKKDELAKAHKASQEQVRSHAHHAPKYECIPMPIAIRQCFHARAKPSP